jgi:hypothetical protein
MNTKQKQYCYIYKPNMNLQCTLTVYETYIYYYILHLQYTQ